MRALIVDDSRFVRSYLRGMLQARGIECEEAGDGQAALEMLRQGAKFDVVFVDWNMPVMNGIATIERLRAENLRDLKIMMVTTLGETDCIVQALAAGADEYLMKPFDSRALSEKLALLGIREV
jgi:two-component system chemotaxis response regulator CheY